MKNWLEMASVLQRLFDHSGEQTLLNYGKRPLQGTKPHTGAKVGAAIQGVSSRW
jgi:hypothetical protein